MDQKDQEELFGCLKACFDLAVHVSPLVLLGTIPGTGFRMLRSKLIQVSYSSDRITRSDPHLTVPQWGHDLGPKPDYILDAEKAVWFTVMGIALGRDSSELLRWFVQSSSEQFDTLQLNSDNIAKYFVNGAMTAAVHVDADDDVVMAVDDTGAQMHANQDDVSMLDAQVAQPDSHPTTPITTEKALTPSAYMPIPDSPTSPKDSSADHLLAEGRTSVVPPPPPSNPPDSPGHVLSPLSDLPELEQDDDLAIPAPEVVHPEVRASGRTIKVPGRFLSGAALTKPAAPAPKKRKLESAEFSPGPVTVAMKEEELYWATAFAHVTAAVSLKRSFISF